MNYQINYIYYYDLPGQQGMMCERYNVGERYFDTKEEAKGMCERLNKANKKSGKFVVKPVSNGSK